MPAMVIPFIKLLIQLTITVVWALVLSKVIRTLWSNLKAGWNRRNLKAVPSTK